MLHVSAKLRSCRSKRMSPERSAKHATRRKRIFCARNAMTPTGTASSAASTRRTCAPSRGANWCARKLCWTSLPAAADGLHVEQTRFRCRRHAKNSTSPPAPGGAGAARRRRHVWRPRLPAQRGHADQFHAAAPGGLSQPPARSLFRRPAASRLDSRSGAQQGSGPGTLSALRSLAAEMPFGFCFFRPARPSTITRS